MQVESIPVLALRLFALAAKHEDFMALASGRYLSITTSERSRIRVHLSIVGKFFHHFSMQYYFNFVGGSIHDAG